MTSGGLSSTRGEANPYQLKK